ncbi:MAG: hypothetical protein ACRC92_08560 [Peptostreptococcaceae bacterium]
MEKKIKLIEPLLSNGKVYRLKCEKCKSISVQISESEQPDYTCFECGGKCKIF